MRISCPSCGAEYDVPVEKLPPGRNVRCVRCTHTWRPVAEVIEPPAAPEPTRAPSDPAALSPATPPDPKLQPTPEPTPQQAAQPIRPDAPASPPAANRSTAPLVAWAITFLVLAIAAYAAITHRAAIMHAWPPSTRAYAWLGLRA